MIIGFVLFFIRASHPNVQGLLWYLCCGSLGSNTDAVHSHMNYAREHTRNDKMFYTYLDLFFSTSKEFKCFMSVLSFFIYWDWLVCVCWSFCELYRQIRYLNLVCWLSRNLFLCKCSAPAGTCFGYEVDNILCWFFIR